MKKKLISRISRTKVYDYPLTEWIQRGLHGEMLAGTVAAIKKNDVLPALPQNRKANSAYLEKILREEALKQFEDSLRPFLEVALNAVDAKPSDEENDYRVYIKTKRRKYICEDTGTGMSIENILRDLIIPFSSQKDSSVHIGRFGVGFYATLGYCLARPRRGQIDVDTTADVERYLCSFYAQSDSVSDLRLRIQRLRRARQKGTTVTMRHYPKEIEPRRMGEYIQKYTEDIPSFKAKIYLDGKCCNDLPGKKWYSAPVEVETTTEKVKRTIIQPQGLLIHYTQRDRELFKDLSVEELEVLALRSGSFLRLNSMGVFVRNSSVVSPLRARVAFPPAVQVVEGRDEFKKDEIYQRCARATFAALNNFIDHETIDLYLHEMLIDFIPALAATFDLKPNADDIPLLPQICEKLYPQKKFALLRADAISWKNFLSAKALDDVLFYRKGSSASFWEVAFLGKKEFFAARTTQYGQIYDPLAFVNLTCDNGKYPNLHQLAEIITEHQPIVEIQLLGVQPVGRDIFHLGIAEMNSSKSTLGVSLRLSIDVDHPAVVGQWNALSSYTILSEYCCHLSRQRDIFQGTQFFGAQPLEKIEEELRDRFCRQMAPTGGKIYS